MKEILLNNGSFTIVDDEDYETFFPMAKSFYVDGGGYAKFRHDNDTIWLHRIIMHLSKGDGLEVDHINGDVLDNRKCNLRITDRFGNTRNTKKRKDSKSPYKGVERFRKRWRARIKTYGVYYHLGVFDSPEEAAIAYNNAALEKFGKFAKLNLV